MPNRTATIKPEGTESNRLRAQRVAPLAVIALAATGGGLLTRFLFTHPTGIGLLNSVPDKLWRTYHHAVGLADEGNVEALQDADATLVFAVCVAGITAAVYALLRIARARRTT